MRLTTTGEQVRPVPASRGERSRIGASRTVDVLLVVGVWLAGALVYFRAQWSSGFTRLMGDAGDARLITYLNEHWFRVLHGQVSWQNPAFFYPVKDLLGWSDGLFLYQFFYAPAREFGCDPFLALQLTLILVSLLGFVSFVYLVRRAFAAPRLIALAGGLIFTFANNLFLHSNHAQLSGIYFVPPILLLGLAALQQAPIRPRRAIAYGGLFGALWALLFFTAYYVAMFSTLAGLITLIAAVLTVRARAWRWATRAAAHAWQPVLAAVIGFGAAIIPFIMTYLPSRTQTGELTYPQVLALFAIPWHDLLNLGPGNAVWSSLFRSLTPPNPNLSELSYAVTPTAMVLALGGGALALWWLRCRKAVLPTAASAAVVLSLTLIVLCVLPIKTHVGSLWIIVWHIPGGKVIRAIDRIGIVAGLVAALAIVAGATEASKHLGGQNRIALRAACMAVLALALAEQLNTSNPSVLDRHAQTRLLASARKPPAGCKSFYVVGAAASVPDFEVQIDAMLISQKFSIPTLNGYTAYNPKGWNLDDVASPAYRTYVRAWETAHGLTSGVCELDLATQRWAKPPP